MRPARGVERKKKEVCASERTKEGSVRKEGGVRAL